MKIPSKIKILAHEYNVIINNKPMLGRGTSGQCCANLLEIGLDPSVPESRRSEALLHEIIEALKYHLELNIEHQDLSALSEGLFTVIRDNGISFVRPQAEPGGETQK